MKKILIYGYGNPGRQDDGLGIFLTDKLESWIKQSNIDYVDVDSNYQLNIEDAYNINEYQVVIFVDASKENLDDFKFESISPVEKPRFTMHSVSPEYVIGLCEQLFGYFPKTYLMHIKGFEWEFMKEPTARAKDNLEKAYQYLVQKIQELN